MTRFTPHYPTVFHQLKTCGSGLASILGWAWRDFFDVTTVYDDGRIQAHHYFAFAWKWSWQHRESVVRPLYAPCTALYSEDACPPCSSTPLVYGHHKTPVLVILHSKLLDDYHGSGCLVRDWWQESINPIFVILISLANLRFFSGSCLGMTIVKWY